MADELRVVITAKDGASRVFKEVGTAAKGVGTDAEKAGQQGERGFKRMGDAAQKTKIDTQALGAALTALGAGLAYSSAMAMQQERQLIGLNRAFGDNADAVIRYAEELDNLTIFSDDDIRAGQRYFATLQNNYDLSIEQIKDLMATTAELAAASGTSFEDASSRVTAAIRGEGEAAEYLNLTMNQQSIDRNNLTLSMSNQEAAQFRLNALNEQAAVYIGTNSDLLKTDIGTMAEWADRAQDMGASIGGWIGPMGAAVSSIGMLGFGLTGMAGGYNLVTTAAMRNSLAMKGSAAAMLLARAATNPWAMALTAVAVAGVTVWKLLPELSNATEEYNASVESLNLSLEELRRRGDDGTATRLEGIQNTVAAMRELNEEGESYEAWAYARGKQPHPLGANHDEEWKVYQENLAQSYELTDEIINLLAEAAFDPNIDQDAYFKWVNDLLSAAAATQGLADDSAALIRIAETPLSDFAVAKTIEEDSEHAIRSVRGFSEALEENTAAALRGAVGMKTYGAAANAIGAGFAEIAAAEMEEYAAWLDVVTDNLNRLLAVAGYDDPLSRWNLSGHASDASLLAMNLQNASESLDSTFRVIVGNTDAIASQVAGIQTWADELINVEGQYGKIDDLLRDGLITQEQYNDAQLAYNGIAADNLRIQNDVLAIQAMQAPLIADQTAAMADYMAEIRDLPAEQQLVALGWMDATTAGRAMELQTLAIAAANGELGANGQQAFESMIVGAAQADPVLKALLIDMGLISEGADGTISVNMSGAEGARSEIGMLTDAIVGFIDLTDDGTLNGSFSISAEDNASDVIRTVRDGRDELNGSSATVSIYLNDYASLGISAASSALDLLNGKVAETTIRTIYDTRGIGPGMMNGGVVEAYADGGVVIRAGEIGPEIIHYANGGTAVMPYDGLYSVPVGSYISPSHASQSRLGGSAVVTFTGNFYGSNRQELEAWADGYLVPAMVDAINDERRGQVRT